MNIVFRNKGTLSLLDMTTMGDSVKRGDSSKIGKFDSGLKYPIIKSRIDNLTCLPDIRKKCIYVTSEFKLDNLWEIIKAQFRIEGEDDVNYVYKEYAKLLTK